MPSLSYKIDNGPALFAPLKVIKTQIGQLSPPEAAFEQNGDHRAVSFTFERRDVRGLPQRASFGRRQPIAQPHAKLLDALYPPDASCKFRAQQPGVSGLVGEPSDRKPHVDGSRCEISRFKMNSIPQDDRPIK